MKKKLGIWNIFFYRIEIKKKLKLLKNMQT